MTFYWRWYKKDVKIKFDDEKNSMQIEADDGVETIPYLSTKNEIKKDDDADIILYVSRYNSPKHGIDEKIYVEPKLETIKESEEKTLKTEDDDFIKSVIDENKVDIQISKEIKKIQWEDITNSKLYDKIPFRIFNFN